MKFYLKTDKDIIGVSGHLNTFIEAGLYDVVRLFDAKRVIIATGLGKNQQLTIVKIKDGELSHG